MKLHKIYIIIEVSTNKILHSTTDRWESMKKFDELQKVTPVIAQTIYH